MATATLREQQRLKWRENYQEAFEVTIDPVIDPVRRAESARDPFFALSTYFPERFYFPWTETQRDIVEEITRRMVSGGDKAVAAPRGEGKTSIVEGLVIMSLLHGKLKFPLICAATGRDAGRILENIKSELEFNELLHADFPEVTCAIRHLEGSSQRTKMQRWKGGDRTRMKWSADYVVLPTRKESASSGSVLMTRGLDGAIRGVRHENLRPDFVLIDDPETRESATSDTQIKARSAILEKDLGGIGGQGRKISSVILCTIMAGGSVAQRFTDPSAKPGWGGVRHRLIKEWPTRPELWAKYIELRQIDQRSGDSEGKTAHQFYVDNRKEMDAGAVVSNDNRAVTDIPVPELSTLQHVYNFIADKGKESFDTEYQNDPPSNTDDEVTEIDPIVVRSRLNGYERGQCPEDATRLVAFVDVGMYRLHWLVYAVRSGNIGCVVDYGTQTTDKPRVVGTEQAIMTALREIRDELFGNGWVTSNLEVTESNPEVTPSRLLDLCLVDSGRWDSAVLSFCAESGGAYVPSMGDARFLAPSGPSKTKIPGGEYWYVRIRPDGAKVVNMSPDPLKLQVHERFVAEHMGDDGHLRPHSLTLFGSEPIEHADFASQICAEVHIKGWKEGPKGYELKEYWAVKSKQNHYLDCMYGAVVAAEAVPEKPAKRQAVVSAGISRPDGRAW